MRNPDNGDNMFYVYEMVYQGGSIDAPDLNMVHFNDRLYPQYERIYNECFYNMRKALNVTPFNFYSDIRQLSSKKDNLFLLLKNGLIIGGVGCFDSEIDDLFVNSLCQGRGYGQRLLIWAVNHIRAYSSAPISLHVAEWNTSALGLYSKTGFTIRSKQRIG